MLFLIVIILWCFGGAGIAESFRLALLVRMPFLSLYLDWFLFAIGLKGMFE
jgi:hypothetical protein